MSKLLQLQIKGDRIMVEPVKVKSDTIVIPQSAKTVATGEFIVRAIGDGKNIPAEVKIGTKVAMMPIGGHVMADNKTERVFIVYSAQDIIGIFPDEPETVEKGDGTIIVPGNFGN